MDQKPWDGLSVTIPITLIETCTESVQQTLTHLTIFCDP